VVLREKRTELKVDSVDYVEWLTKKSQWIISLNQLNKLNELNQPLLGEE